MQSTETRFASITNVPINVHTNKHLPRDHRPEWRRGNNNFWGTMKKSILLGLIVLFDPLSSGAAMATPCISFPNALTNGTTADGSQVIGNLAYLSGCLAPLASPSFTGNVGIGVSPSNVLDILQNTNGGAQVLLSNPNAGTSASMAFSLYNGATSGAMLLFGSGATTSGIYRQNGVVVATGGAGGLTLTTQTAQPVYFAVNQSEVGRFGSDGSFLVGTAVNGGWSGNAQTAILTSGTFALSAYNTGSVGASLEVRVDNASTNFASFYYSGSTLVGSIAYDLGTGVTQYNTTSDARLKTVLSTQKDYRSTIENLWVGDFGWRKTRARSFGILAQQAYPLFPEAVTPPHGGPDIWQADYGKLAPLALWGVKDLYKIAGSLDEKRAAFNTQLKLLTKQMAMLQAANDNQAAEIRLLRTQVGLLQRKAGIQTAEK